MVTFGDFFSFEKIFDFFCKKVLTSRICYAIIHKLSDGRHQCGGIAQLARATGSYPVGHGFKSNSRYQRPVGQAVKTPPFHGGNGGSIPPRVTKTKNTLRCVLLFYLPFFV